MGSILINSFTAPVGVTADIYAADANGNNQELLPGVFSQIGFTDNDGNFSPYPVLFDILATSTLVSLTADCSNGCVLTFQQVCLPSFPTPTPTDLPPCYFAAVSSLDGPGNTLTYIDCNGTTTAYTSTSEALVYLCMPFQNIFNVDFSVNLDSGYDCYSIPDTSPLEWVGEAIPTSTPTPTAVTPTPTPTDVAYTYETMSLPYSWPSASATRPPSVGSFKIHPEYVGSEVLISYNGGQLSIPANTTNIINFTIPMTAASGTIVVSAATNTASVIEAFAMFRLTTSTPSTYSGIGQITATTTQLKRLSDAIEIYMENGIQVTGNIQEFSALTSLQSVKLENGDYNGDIQYLPNSIKALRFEIQTSSIKTRNQNTISGNIGNLPTSIESMVIGGLNTITGNLSSLAGLFNNPIYSLFIINGNNTISGNMSDLPDVAYIGINDNPYNIAAAYYMNVLTGNTISGNFTLKPNHVIVVIGGGNTITGDLSSTQVPSSLTSLSIAGLNTIGGNVNLLKLPTNVLQLYGNNVVTGSINDIITNPEIYEITILNYGQYGDNNGTVVMTSGNTLSGNINAFQTCLSLDELQIGGLNTITGDISSLLPLASDNTGMFGFWIVSPMNTINAANFVTTNPRLFTTSFLWTFVSNNSGNGMNATEVNKLLIYFDSKITSPVSGGSIKKLVIDGTAHAAPSGTGITAKDSLISKGITVITN